MTRASTIFSTFPFCKTSNTLLNLFNQQAIEVGIHKITNHQTFFYLGLTFQLCLKWYLKWFEFLSNPMFSVGRKTIQVHIDRTTKHQITASSVRGKPGYCHNLISGYSRSRSNKNIRSCCPFGTGLWKFDIVVWQQLRTVVYPVSWPPPWVLDTSIIFEAWIQSCVFVGRSFPYLQHRFYRR